jgi:asparagine synthase (glutamine-hydrolysing)
VPGWIQRGLLRPLADRLPFEAPGWNYLYAAGYRDLQRAPTGLDVFFPYIRDRLYTRDTLDRMRTIDVGAESARLMARAAHLDPVSRFQYVDTMQYLPADILVKVDRMSMANSLEVRSPLLDHPVVEYMATLPVAFKLRGGISKYVLRKVAERLLPHAVLTKRKQGFALPADRWFRGDLRQAAAEILLDHQTLSRGYFRKETITRMLKHHAAGHRDYSAWIWCLVVLETWFREYLDEPWSVQGKAFRPVSGH